MYKFLKKYIIPLPGIKSHKIISNTHKHVCTQTSSAVHKSENLAKKGTYMSHYRNLLKQIISYT